MQCPVCRRVTNDDTNCARCGFEFNQLLALQKKYDFLMSKAQNKLKQQNFRDSYNFYSKAAKINNTAEAQKGMFVTLVASEQFKKAMKIYQNYDN